MSPRLRLMLYSGYDEANATIDAALVKLIGKPRPKITYIPSANHVPDDEYQYFCDNFADHGFSRVKVLHIDQPYSSSQLAQALSSDLIYLSGGNTFYFLKSMQNQGLDTELIKYARRGGVLAGLSAGAILMTPTIATASYPKFDRDDNDVGIVNLSALNLVNFEIFPHYAAHEEYRKELTKQSKRLDRPIYAVADGGAIMVNGSQLTFFGNVWAYFEGKEFKVSPAVTE